MLQAAGPPEDSKGFALTGGAFSVLRWPQAFPGVNWGATGAPE